MPFIVDQKEEDLFDRLMAFRAYKVASTPAWRARMGAKYDMACEKVGSVLPCHCCPEPATALDGDGKPVCNLHS